MLLVLFLGIVALAHLVPAPFVFDWASRDVSMWRVPQPPDGQTVYLTFDDGPNPEATPALLDLLARERVRATFFLLDRHLNEQTAPIVRRMAADGHGIALHSHTRAMMLLPPDEFDRALDAAADRIASLTGVRPCRAFRPHGAGRSLSMIAGLRQGGRRLVGWGLLLWDRDWGRARPADRIVQRIGSRARAGSIVVMHDGHHEDPRADRRYMIEATARLIPLLRAKGLEFGTICDVIEGAPSARNRARADHPTCPPASRPSRYPPTVWIEPSGSEQESGRREGHARCADRSPEGMVSVPGEVLQEMGTGRRRRAARDRDPPDSIGRSSRTISPRSSPEWTAFGDSKRFRQARLGCRSLPFHGDAELRRPFPREAIRPSATDVPDERRAEAGEAGAAGAAHAGIDHAGGAGRKQVFG